MKALVVFCIWLVGLILIVFTFGVVPLALYQILSGHPSFLNCMAVIIFIAMMFGGFRVTANRK